jgi:hypothetical protein
VGEVVPAGHRLEQLGAHGRFGGEAGRASQHREGGADAGGGVRLEQRVGVERGGVEALRTAAYLDLVLIHAGQTVAAG